MKRINPKVLTLSALVLFSLVASAQTKPARAPDDSLFQQIAASDAAFFDDAYNNCELAKMESYFTRDIEFYHDQSGLAHL